MNGLEIRSDSPKPGFTILRLSGEFEGMAVHEAKEKLFAYFAAPGTKEIYLDMGEIAYIDSSAIGVLLELVKAAQISKIKFGLMNVSEPIRKVIEITKVDKIIKIY